ncbi:class I tRNA ligase family protein, partial [Patescibacteria group bacterium]|nr:class I tRNA ligase family protein [Patescibacteria group bacterium]
NPKDKRYRELIGRFATIPLLDKQIPVIADQEIKIDFGTGALKVTPGHDATDWEIGLRQKLSVIETIDHSGRLINVPDKYLGMKVSTARQQILEDLKAAGKLIKVEPLTHTLSTCYRCGTVIEPMLSPQWYIKIKPLAEPAIKAVKSGKTKIVPQKVFEKMYFDWLENITDWNISRQIVWGPRIPAWYCLDCHPEIIINFIDDHGQKVSGRYADIKGKYTAQEIKKGLQSLTAPVGSEYLLEEQSECAVCSGQLILQETDTFDTWFLSGQWPFNALGYPDSEDFKYFYPTSVLDTLWDILFFWVARMMMLGIFRTGKPPFEVIHLHARVVDKHGQKMSKSKGNTINPIDMVEKYGADALRMALIFGVAPAADIALSEDKVRAMRNFGNKIWNMARFFLMEADKHKEQMGSDLPFYHPEEFSDLPNIDKQLLDDLTALTKLADDSLAKYRFSDAAEGIYHFMWDELASKYLENTKLREDKALGLAVFRYAFLTCLKLLHPFMPFITEEIWSHLPKEQEEPLIIAPWPVAS